MKQVLFAVVIIITFCCFKPWETIKGNGNSKKESREVKNFTGISVSGSMNVELDYGKGNALTVEADDNLLPYIETVVKDGMLVIKSKDNVNLKSKSKIVVHASATMLTELKVSGSGDINGKGDFYNDGTTAVSLSGSGNINMGVKSFSETKISISGSGNVKLSGESTESVEASISGSGDIDCSEFSCDNVEARVSGSGNIKVFANKSIDAKVSGSGNIYYKGAATNINMKSAGSGKVIKM